MNKQDMTSVIWNLTRLGPWSCKICCVDAICIHGNCQVNLENDVYFSYKDELNFIQKKRNYRPDDTRKVQGRFFGWRTFG